VLGFGAAAAPFLPGVAYLRITKSHDSIENGFFAVMHCVAGVSFASFPLPAWRNKGSRHTDPGLALYGGHMIVGSRANRPILIPTGGETPRSHA